MGVVGWVTKSLGDALLELLRDDMFKPVRLCVNLIPLIAKYLVQEQFKQPVMANDFECDAFPILC